MRRVLIALLVLLLQTTSDASAQTTGQTPAPPPTDPCRHGLGGGAIDCLKDYVGQIGGSAGAAGATGSSSGPATRYIPYARLTNGADGQPCVTTAYYAEGASSPADVAPSEVPAADRIPGSDPFSIYYQTYPPCPQIEGAGSTAGDTPAQFAARFWERVPLPKPRPWIAPGWAITGKLAFLETNGETTKVYTSPSPFGPLEIQATGAYYVDWGDGEQSGPHSREGKPWPEGEIRHDYVWAKTYDIIVTERWTAAWSLGGQTGVLRELRTSATIDDFLARQIQAVVRSG